MRKRREKCKQQVRTTTHLSKHHRGQPLIEVSLGAEADAMTEVEAAKTHTDTQTHVQSATNAQP